MQRRPPKHTPFRDRPQQEQNDTPSSFLQREFRFNNENEDCSNTNPIMYKRIHLREIRRKGKGQSSNSGSNANLAAEQFQCDEDYEDQVKRSQYLNQNPNQKSRCHSQDNLVKLTQSQEIFFKRPHGMAAMANLPVNSSLTFGSMKQSMLKNSLSSNQEFLQEKKIKNEILDEIIKKSNKMSVVKSQEFLRRSQRPEGAPTQTFTCANQDGKKAKYRVIGDQDQQQLYYCSKCSIMLLQQGFKVEQITRKSEYSRRRKDCEAVFSKITDLQGRLKYHMNSLDSNNGASIFAESKGRLEQTYDIIIFIVQQMRARDFEAMQHAQEKLQTQKKRQKAKLYDRFSKLNSIRQQLQRLISSPQLTESQLVAATQTYSATIAGYERYDPIKFEIQEEPIQQKLQRLINQVNEHYNARKSQQFSFQSDSNTVPDATPQSSHKPFRNLFPQESSKHKRSSRYYNGEFIEEEEDHYSPSFKKEND